MPYWKLSASPLRHPCTLVFWDQVILIRSSGWWPNDIGIGQAKVVDGESAILTLWRSRHISTRWTVRRYQKEPATCLSKKRSSISWFNVAVTFKKTWCLYYTCHLLKFEGTFGTWVATNNKKSKQTQNPANQRNQKLLIRNSHGQR